MTREERLAGGWTECFGVYHEDVGWWQQANWEKPIDGSRQSWSLKPSRRFAFESIGDAKKFTMHHPEEHSYARRFWRRKKPKAPAPLKIGDDVLVRGKVSKLDPGTDLDVRLSVGAGLNVRLSVGERAGFWCSSKDCERVKP